MIPLYYDLHIHSCLSSCGDDEMTPGNLVGMASVKGLQVIALTDHNSCRNCPAALSLGETYGMIVIPGMELCTREEVHVICLFPTLADAMSFDSYVSQCLLPIPNQEKIFGKQEIRDCEDRLIGHIANLLISATSISFDDLDTLLPAYHGIYFPAHLDRSSTSLLSNLGFIPPASHFQCAELHHMKELCRIQKEHPYLQNCNILCNSDAHYLTAISEPVYQIISASTAPSDILAACCRKV